MSEQPVTHDIPPASWTGRLGKLLVGYAQLQFVVAVIPAFSELIAMEPAAVPDVWMVVALGWLLLPTTLRLGFGRILSTAWPAVSVLAGLVAVAGIAGWLQSGAIWTPWIAGALLSVALGVHGYMGFCHAIAGLTGMRGCEMRVIPYYFARWGGNADAHLVLCPGFWTSVDRWEAGLRERRRAS